MADFDRDRAASDPDYDPDLDGDPESIAEFRSIRGLPSMAGIGVRSPFGLTSSARDFLPVAGPTPPATDAAALPIAPRMPAPKDRSTTQPSDRPAPTPFETPDPLAFQPLPVVAQQMATPPATDPTTDPASDAPPPPRDPPDQLTPSGFTTGSGGDAGSVYFNGQKIEGIDQQTGQAILAGGARGAKIDDWFNQRENDMSRAAQKAQGREALAASPVPAIRTLAANPLASAMEDNGWAMGSDGALYDGRTGAKMRDADAASKALQQNFGTINDYAATHPYTPPNDGTTLERYMINGEVVTPDGELAPSAYQQQRTIGGVTTPYRNPDANPGVMKPEAATLNGLDHALLDRAALFGSTAGPVPHAGSPQPTSPTRPTSPAGPTGPASPRIPVPPITTQPSSVGNGGLTPNPTPAPPVMVPPTPHADANGLPDTSPGTTPAMQAVQLSPTTPNTALTNSTITPGPAVDRFGIAKRKFDDWEASTDPAIQAQMRDANRWSAAAGRIGSGLATNSIGDISLQRENDIRSKRNSFLDDAMVGSIDDAWKSIGLEERQQQFQSGEQSKAFSQQMELQRMVDSETGQLFEQQMRTMGWNADQIQRAFQNAMDVQRLSDDETGQAFYRAMQQEMQGSQNNPADYYAWLAGQWARGNAAA